MQTFRQFSEAANPHTVDNGVEGNGWPKHYEVHRNGKAIHHVPNYMSAVDKAKRPGDEIHGEYRNGVRQHIATQTKDGLQHHDPK